MYEFSQAENATFSRAALWTKALAGAALLQAVVNFLNPGQVWPKVLGLLIVSGIVAALLKASSALGCVVTTEGNDIQHTMEAIEAWTFLFTVRLVLVGFLFALSLANAVFQIS
jgi:hypothetical protein